MGRIFTTLGMLLILGGIVGTVVSAVRPESFQVSAFTSAPTAAQLCQPGETLHESKGASQYTPGQGYGRSVQYACEDSTGQRRDVTGNFVSGLMGQIPDFMSGLMGPFVWGGLVTLGVILLVIGSVMSRFQSGGLSRPQVYVNGQPVSNQSLDAWRQLGQTSSLSVTEKLRQLDTLYEAGLIKRAEYDKIRQKLMDQLT